MNTDEDVRLPNVAPSDPPVCRVRVRGSAAPRNAENGDPRDRRRCSARSAARLSRPGSYRRRSADGGTVTGRARRRRPDRDRRSRSTPARLPMSPRSAAEKIYRSTGDDDAKSPSDLVGRQRRLARIPAARDDPVRRRAAAPPHRSSWRRAPGFSAAASSSSAAARAAKASPMACCTRTGRCSRDGALVWGDALHLDGDVAAIIADPACFDGAAACATLILAPRDGDPRRFVDGARGAAAIAAAGLRGRGHRGQRAPRRALARRDRWRCAAPLPISLAICAQAAMGLPPRLPRLWHV